MNPELNLIESLVIIFVSEIFLIAFSIFGPWVYPMGSIVIALVRPLVRLLVRPSVFKYLEVRSLVFSETLYDGRGQ